MRVSARILLVASMFVLGLGTIDVAAAATLTVAKAGSGVGLVSSVVGIDCGPTCSGDIAGATPVTLTAVAGPGSVFTGWLGACAGTGACQFTINGPTAVSATFALAVTATPSLDFDGSNSCDAPTDGILAIRYLFGVPGIALSVGATGTNAQRFTAAEIADYLTDIRPALDIDGNGQTDPLTDGLLITRYLFGARGAALIAGVIGPGATRSTAEAIEAYFTPLNAVCTATAVARIEIAPAALLLTQSGATGQFTATAFDAQNNPVNVPIVWSSSLPGTVSVNATGAVQTGMGVGTALITAMAGNIKAEPAPVYVATPVAGALLINDNQIIAGPTSVDPNAPPDPANPYTVVLRGVAAMPINTIVINTGAKPVGGRVTNVQAQGTDLLVRLVVVPPQQMFSGYAFKEVVDLSKGPFETPTELAAAYEIEQTGSTFVFTPKPGGVAARLAPKVGEPQGTVALPPFTECVSTVGFPSGLPVALAASPGFVVTVTGTLVNELTPQGNKIALSAAPVFTLSTVLEATSAFEAKLTCKLVLQRRPVPAPGVVGLFLGGSIEFGVGFEVGGKLTLVSAKVGATSTLKTALEAGILCPADGDCGLTGSATADATFTPVFQAPSLDQLKLDPSLSLFGYVSGRIGNPQLRELQFEAIEARAGATLLASYTLEALQMNNLDPLAGRSKYQLDIEGKVGPGKGLSDFLAYTGLTPFIPLKLSFLIPLGKSPTGTAASDKGLYFVGDPINLEVKLTAVDTTFFAGSLYNVDRVVILRQTGALSTPQVLAEKVATPGQTNFAFAFNAPVQISASELFAFAVPKFLGFAPLPRLEIASAQGAGARITATLPAQLLATADLIVTVETPTGNGQFGPAANMLVEFTSTCATVNPASARTDQGGQLSVTVTLSPGCDSLAVDMVARVDPGTAVLATQSVSSVRIRPRIRAIYPGQVYGPAALAIIVERPIGNADYERAPNMLVQLTPTCAMVNPLSGRTDASGNLTVTVSPLLGCTSLSIVVTARAAPDTGLEAQAAVTAAVIPGASPLLSGYDGTENSKILCVENCPTANSSVARWRLFADNASFLLVRQVGSQFFCPTGPTSTCLLKFPIIGGQFEARAGGMTISGSVGAGRLRFVLDQPCVNNDGQPSTCRRTFDGSRFTLALSPTNLDFGTVPIGTTATKFVTIRNAGLGPAQISTGVSAGYLLNGDTCFQGPSPTFFLDAGVTCSVAIQFTPQNTNTLVGTLNVAASALGATNVQAPLTGKGN